MYYIKISALSLYSELIPCTLTTLKLSNFRQRSVKMQIGDNSCLNLLFLLENFKKIATLCDKHLLTDLADEVGLLVAMHNFYTKASVGLCQDQTVAQSRI